MVSAFSNAIEFLAVLGIYDVVLPFLITFTIVFAIFEKTKILGVEKIDKNEYTKKNLNALVGFCVAFFVVASSNLVSIINETMGHIAILLIMSIAYLLLIGSFFKNGEDVFLDKGPWRTGFMVAILIGIILIFMNAAKTSSGETWLEWTYDKVVYQFDSAAVSSIVLIIIIIAVVAFLTKSSSPQPKTGGDKS